ncbi:MAG: low-specificity L-threonine aldolase [Negativicutes bacterium]|nr:low-specificity L-threonine aldolase [Negativicutes bacterium]
MKMLDFRSDTITKPSLAMRAAMAAAEVGDDVYGEDPTINKLEELAAEMTGFEAALFVTSGTQGNLLALLSHCRSGDEVILEEDSHIFVNEVGGMAALGGIQAKTLRGPLSAQGALDPAAVEAAIRADNIHYPVTTLVCLENTHNKGGGAASTPAQMQAVAKVAHAHGMHIHLDGARAFNAAVAQQITIKTLLQGLDSAQLCLSKGLGAPVGSVLVGERDFIRRARKWRKMVGGGMRQAGVIAAAGLYALQYNIPQLSVDHAHAALLADALDQVKGLQVVRPNIMTNLVVVNTEASGKKGTEWVAVMAGKGIKIGANGPYSIRFATHLDLSHADIKEAVERIDSIE